MGDTAVESFQAYDPEANVKYSLTRLAPGRCSAIPVDALGITADPPGVGDSFAEAIEAWELNQVAA